jgi:hypothetical protein
MTRPLRRILAATVATAGLVATVPAAQAAQPDPNEPIICIRCGALSQLQISGWVVNPPIKQLDIGTVARP